MNDTLSLTLRDLSWNALLVGWRQGSLQFNDVRERAEAYITAAPDELLTPLSELASLDGLADRIEIEDAIQTLAESEPLQARLGQREWRAWDASQLLAELQEILTRSAGRANFEALPLVEEFWHRYGNPATVPPATFLFIYTDDPDDLELVTSEFGRWLKSEQAVIRAAKTLYGAGHSDHATVFLEAMELATGFARQNIEKAETRASAFERLTLGTTGRMPYEDYQRHNDKVYRRMQNARKV